jgi:hypothetical protein
MECEVIKEVLTTIWKVFQRVGVGREKMVSKGMLEDMQLLLGI